MQEETMSGSKDQRKGSLTSCKENHKLEQNSCKNIGKNCLLKAAGKQHTEEASTRCCVPSGCNEESKVIRMDNLGEAVAVICNNPDCDARFMHKDCFEDWESSVLSYLRTLGRARSWSEKQRLQNLWTKKGYDLTYKACGCKCGRGHLRKDLDWIPPSVSFTRRNSEADQDDLSSSSSKKKKKNRGKKVTTNGTTTTVNQGKSNISASDSCSSTSPSPNATPVGSVTSSSHSLVLRRQSSSELSTTSSNSANNSYNNNGVGHSGVGGGRNNSVSSTCSSSGRNRTFSMSSTGSTGGTSGGASPPIFEEGSSSSPDLQSTSVRRLFFGESERNYSSYNNQSYHSKYNIGNNQKYNNSVATSSSSRERTLSGTMFSRRPDYSTFNILPRTKINSYHIRMEDETSHGNDDIRTLILSTLSANGMNRVNCILCHGPMPIFEKFPLIDGTFFLSPRQHAKSAVPLLTTLTSSNSTTATILANSSDKKYLNAVCMGCCEGWTCILKCRGCNRRWDGSHLILGSMYTYDIFAAIPCCVSRLRCNNCSNIVIPSSRKLEFFSEFSQSMSCQQCGTKDFHFVKPLPVTFVPSARQADH